MTLLYAVDLIGMISAVIALLAVALRRPAGVDRDVRLSLMALFGVVLLNYGVYAAAALAVSRPLEVLSNLSQVMAPLAFFFVFYAFVKSQAGRELQASEERYRALFESATDGLLISNLEGTEWDANPALCALHGYPREEFLKAPPWTYIHPADLDEFRAFREALGAGRAYEGMARGARRDGTFYRAEVRASRVQFAGKPHIMGVIRDVSERVEAQQARERLVTVIEATTDLVGTSAPDGGALYMNQSGRSMLGIGAEEDITGTSPANFHTAESFEIIREIGMPVAIQEGLWRGETQLRSRDGRVTEVSQVIIAHRDSENRITHLSTIARDISESKRAAEAVQASERRLFRFMEHLPVGIVIMTRAGETYHLNRTGREMLQIEESQRHALPELSRELGIYRAGTDELYPPADYPAVRALAGERVHVDDFEVRRGGRVIPLEVWASPIRDDSDVITHSIAAFMDISERKAAEGERLRLEEQLLQSQKMESIGMLAGGVAHDFNNLLVAIVGYSEIILSSADERTPFVSEVQEIRRAGERAAALTRQLLAFSRKQVLQPTVLDLNRVVRETEKLLRRVIGEHIDLISFLSPSGVRIEADPVQLEQVIVNLAVNARDAMPNGGRLVFETRTVFLDDAEARNRGFAGAGPFARLTVSDTGCGMDEAVRRKIFEPFFTTKERDKGTGLGLSTVYGIVKQSGGEIEVDSTPGRGSAFHLYFPAIEAAIPAEAGVNGHSLAGPPMRGTILLVEDEAAPRRLSVRVLKEAGYQVLEAVSGEAALELSRRCAEPIDLLLTDVVLPGLGGGELAEQLVGERPELRVLYTSGYADNPIVQQSVREGGAFLQKPFTPKELTQAVRGVLEGA